MITKVSNIIKGMLIATVLVLLPACDMPSWLGGDKSGAHAHAGHGHGDHSACNHGAKEAHGATAVDEHALVHLDGRAVVTEDAFSKKFNQMLQANAYTKDIAPEQIPAEVKIKFLEDWVNVIVIRDVWGAQNNVQESFDFKEALAERVDGLVDMLVVERFVANLRDNLSVSDREVRKDFEKNKARYTKVAGGVRVAGAHFADKIEAAGFADSLEDVGAIGDFETIVKTSKNARYRDFGRIDKDTLKGAPEVLAHKALSRSRFPGVDMVSVSDDEHWVFLSADKVAPEYYELDEVAPQIKSMLEEQMFADVLAKEIEKLKSKADITINEEFFKN